MTGASMGDKSKNRKRIAHVRFHVKRGDSYPPTSRCFFCVQDGLVSATAPPTMFPSKLKARTEREARKAAKAAKRAAKEIDLSPATVEV